MWEGGSFRGTFRQPDDLQDGVTRALHDVTLANATGPVDERDMMTRALAMFAPENRNQVIPAMLELVVVGGPNQRISRPAEMEAPQLAGHLEQTALYGESRMLDRSLGVISGLDGSDLVLRQERGASIRLTEQGSIAVRLPLDEPRSARGFDPMSGMVLVEETVKERTSIVLAYVAAVLDHLDRTQRLTHLAIALRIVGADHRGWRTRAQHAANTTSIQIGHGGMGEREPITLSARRAALGLDRSALIADLLVPLRRQFPVAS